MKSFLLFATTLLMASTAAIAEWREGTRLPTAVPHAVAAEMDGKLYVMSGKVGQGLRSFFEQYDLQNDGWRPLTPLPVNISQYAIAAGTGRVFVTGGAKTIRRACLRVCGFMPLTRRFGLNWARYRRRVPTM